MRDVFEPSQPLSRTMRLLVLVSLLALGGLHPRDQRCDRRTDSASPARLRLGDAVCDAPAGAAPDPMYDLRADDAVQLVRLVLLRRLLTMAAIAWLPVLLSQLARLVALRLWFGSMKRAQEAAEALSGVREREAELIRRGIDHPKTA